MSKKVIKIKTVKPLADGKNGEKRFSLYEDRDNHGVFVHKEGETMPKVGDEVVVTELDITTKDGEKTKGWYFLKFNTADGRKSDAGRDYDMLIEMEKKNILNNYDVQSRIAKRKAIEEAGLVDF